jgi:hypothetical protein
VQTTAIKRVLTTLRLAAAIVGGTRCQLELVCEFPRGARGAIYPGQNRGQGQAKGGSLVATQEGAEADNGPELRATLRRIST